MNQASQNLNDSSERSLAALDYFQVLRSRWGIITLTALLVFFTAVVITKILPKKYTSSSIIQIHFPQTYSPVPGATQQTLTGHIPQRFYLENQIKLVTSEKNLKEVARELDLVSEWGLQDINQAVSIIRSVTSVSPQQLSDLVDIKVQHTDQKECHDLARAISEAYQNQREVEEKSRIDEIFAALDKSLQGQQNIVDEKKDIVDQLTRAKSIIQGDEGQIMAVDRNRTFEQLQELKKEKQTLEGQIRSLLNKTDEELIVSAVGINFVSSRVPTLYEQYVDSERALVGLREQGMGKRHKTMVAAANQHEELLVDLYDAVDDMRVALKENVERVEGEISEMEKLVEDKTTTAIEVEIDTHEYQQAKQEYDQAKAFLDSMRQEYEGQKINHATNPKITIEVHEEPKIPNRHSFPNEKLNFAIGGILGLTLGIGLAFFLEIIDSSVKSLDDVERYLQLPVLAVIPRDIELLHKAGNSPDAEAYRILRTNIEFNKRRSPDHNAITVVSGGAGEGKSTTLINLAYVCAQGGYSTLLIDADLRRPRLHTYFEINNSIGLSNYLTSDLKLEDVILQTPTENLYFMSSGVTQEDPAGILNSNRISGLISEVKDRFDLVFVDSPPILGVSDASVITSECDQTMIVVQHRKLPRNIILRVKQSIEAVGGSILGVVLNNVDIKSDNNYQYYTSYYSYYSGEQSAQPQLSNSKENISVNNSRSKESKNENIY